MKKITLYVGLNDKDSKLQKFDIIEAYKMAETILMQKVSGATIFQASGIYKHDDGTVIIEQTLRIELINISNDVIKEIIDIFKVVFNQESILVQQQSINISFR